VGALGEGGTVLGSTSISGPCAIRSSHPEIYGRERISEMPKSINHRQKSNFLAVRFPGATALAVIPALAVFYVLLVLPFLPDDGKGRVENILFWPVAAALTLTLVFSNWARIDFKFFRSLPIASLIVYLVFASASVTWAYSPDFAFSRLVAQVMVFIVVILPYALPIRVKYTIAGVHLCFAVSLAVSAVYVLTTPPSPIGHPGYFIHKQELGLLGALGAILSAHELMRRGWRRLVAPIFLCLAFWLVLESQSKSALGYALFSLVASWPILLLCKKTRLTPALIVAAVVVTSMFVSNPIERIGYRLYGDATLTGRTGIWGFANYRISQKPWFGWGFHSYYFVPNSPQDEAPGYIREMPSSHSGYLDLKLETGRIGYAIFLVFIYSSLHLLERVRRIDPVRAWCFLSIELFAVLINLLDTHWLGLGPFWLLYLVVVAESVRYVGSSKLSAMTPAAAVHAVRFGLSRVPPRAVRTQSHATTKA
jgi:exopolysaccharide production protein ExoQ